MNRPLCPNLTSSSQPTLRLWARLSILLVVGALALAGSGCSGITVHRATPFDLLRDRDDQAIAADDLSARSLQTLHQLNVDDIYRRSPAEAYTLLQSRVAHEAAPDTLFLLAEMSYLFGRKAEQMLNPHALTYYYFCAGYAYHYLFPRNSSPNGFDPRFRLACDLYNAGLTKCLRSAQRGSRLDPRHRLHLPMPDGRDVTLLVAHHGFAWRPEEFGSLLFAADYVVSGLENQYHGYGLGTPLIGTRQAAAPEPASAFYPSEVNFPVTALLRFSGTVADLSSQWAGELELYNPLAFQEIDVRGRRVPLESDLTTPLAYFLSRSDFDALGYEGFLSPDKIQKRTGMYMCEPYQPGKIPVVMVHGLLSSPMTWAPLFNDLRADPVLRERFQFWFYLYPTANPYVVTAADLRQTLAQLRSELDPQHKDPAFDQMVCVGHSLGGLVCKLLTTDSGTDFWSLVSSVPFDQLQAQPDTRAELQRIFFFQSVPCIRRLVMIGTPHHGSGLSPSWPARLLQHFVQLPRRLLNASKDAVRENPHFWSKENKGSFPTSLDLLAPGAPALELLAARPLPATVHYHSIIGVIPPGNRLLDALLPGGTSREGTDGVVPYSSAHLAGVDSELVVSADHFHVHHQPLAVQEVRRILLEHWHSSTIHP